MKDIYITSLNNTSRVEVLNYIKVFYERDFIYHKDIYDISHILSATKKFKAIKIIACNNNLIIRCLERPMISNINYIGNELKTNNILHNLLQTINIKKRTIFHSNILKVVIKKFKKYYINKNKKNITVKIIVIFSQNNLIDLKIIFSELKNYSIRKINIIGNNSFSKKTILSLFESKDALNWWYNEKKSINYVKNLEIYIKKLKQFYINHGYIYFIINNINVIQSVNKNEVNIYIDYTEGKQYIITNVLLHENIFFHFKDINNVIKSIIDQPYCITNILNIKNNIKDMFLMNGYIDATISIYYVIDSSHNRVVFYFYINSGQLYFLHKIHFHKNKYIKDKLLYHAIKNLEGHYLNIQLLHRFKTSLMEKGYYKNILLTLYPITRHSNQIDAVYTIKEKDSGNIDFNLGYGLHNGISFNFNFMQNNLFGSGINVKLNSVKNDYETSGNITFIDPYFSTLSDFLKGKLFYNIFKPNVIKHNTYKNKNYGFDSKLGFVVDASNKFNIGIGFVHNDFSNKQPKISIWNYSTNLDQYLDNNIIKNSKNNDINCSFLWSYDSLNSHYFPISGNYTTINIQSTLPGFNNFS
ncbi:MAG TPA: outer membrane protein assembly factor BamA, partial [Buchnera sp. (in: enterobacteria)]|nr:outer membrane protein assembly factor BamA [Buchnera sp. (in: enterobacteria)]